MFDIALALKRIGLTKEQRVMKLIVALVASCVLASPGIAKDRYTLQPTATESQPVVWNAGVQQTDDIQPTSVVRIVSVADELPGKPSSFQLFFLNLSDKPVVIGPEDVSLVLPDGKAVTTIAPKDLEAKLRRDIKRRQALATLGGAFSAAGATGETSGSVQYSGMTSDGRLYSGTGTYTAYDPALEEQQVRAAQAQSQRTSDAIEARRVLGSRALSGLMRRASVAPGEVTGGIIAFEAPKSLEKMSEKGLLKIIVRSGDILHSFDVKPVEVE